MMKTSLISFFSLASLALASPNIIADAFNAAGQTIEQIVHVNALGEIVSPERFDWGGLAYKQADAAKPRVCGNRIDASGRLGKRHVTCSYGYIQACDDSIDFPCCPSDTPTCCPNSNHCCGAGQTCQGTSTCCNADQTGCGEACCNSGETCCGTKCCSAGTTCSYGNCISDNGETVTPATLTEATTTSVVTRATGTGTIVVFDSVTPTPSTTTSLNTTTITTTNNNGDDNDNNNNNNNTPHGPSPGTLGGAIGGSLGGATALVGLVWAYIWRKRQQTVKPQDCEKPAEEAPCPVDEPPKPAEHETPYDCANPHESNAYVERPITGAPGMAGHDVSYS